MVVRMPLWFRALYVGVSAGCVLAASISTFAVHTPFAVAFGLMTFVCALALAPIALLSATRRLELRGDRLISVTLTGSTECLVTDISSMRLAAFGNGLSRCTFIRRDGSSVFGKAARTWRTADLMRLAETINVPVQSG
jgi:hypothetical protein